MRLLELSQSKPLLQTLPNPLERRYQVVSLFSGCGGMDLGFMGGFQFGGNFYDRLPFEVIWANDISDGACQTYRLNFGHDIECGDIDTHMDDVPEKADLVTGGFPCQDVSINGARTMDNGGRTILYTRMIDVIRRIKPRAFVAENVKGFLLTEGRPFFDRMMEDFDLPGYNVSHHLYLASDYGVPQVRQRIFIVGVQGSQIFNHPTALHMPPMTAREALADLEDTPECRATHHIWSRAKRSPEQGSRKLAADKPATTIRAEHHGNIQWHYKLPRRISLREAARLQSFPDTFRFASAMRKTERQIGNAVPPVLAWHIAKAIRDHFDTKAI